MALFTVFAGFAAVLAALAPLPLSFVSVWLFAGPHNWMEARYFLSRLPSRWLVRREFLVVAAVGVLALGVWFAVDAPGEMWFTALGVWILLLVRLAGRPAAEVGAPICAAIALAWWNPGVAGLLLLFLHPVAALWFLFRQAGKRWPDRRLAPYGAALFVLAVAVAISRWNGVGPEGEWSSQALTALPAQPALIALHAYLELLHYGAWIVALPAIGLATRPWQWRSIPLARRWPSAIAGLLFLGAVAVIALWTGFAVDYDRVRAIYFSIAIFHVLAEAPMLIWLR